MYMDPGGTQYLHYVIEQLQQRCMAIFDGLIQGENLNRIEEFRSFLAVYNRLPRHTIVTDEDSLEQVPPMRADAYLNSERGDSWAGIFEGEIAYFMVEFLSAPPDRKYVGRCAHCRKYFISSRIGQKFCNTSCQQGHYHSDPQIKKEKARKLREKFGWKERTAGSDL